MIRTDSRSRQSIGDLFRHLMLGWFCAALLEYLLLPRDLKLLDQLNGIAAMSISRLLLVTVLLAAALWCASLRWSFARLERFLCVGVFAVLSVLTLIHQFNWGLFGFCTLALAILTVYAIFGYQQEVALDAPKKAFWIFPLLTAGMTAGIFAFISIWTVCRVLTFSSPSYDFGIFSQMFYYMKKIGQPLTTLERSGLLSHFAVHVSPIYYLMLPIYYLFPYPVTLQVLQAAVITSAVVPMWLIGKQRGLSGLQRTILCGLLLFLPTTAGGAYYDLHENCFLLPLLLWLLYAIDRKSLMLTGVFAVLTLMVKEDAAVYVAVVALYQIVRTLVHYSKENRRELLVGIVLLALSLAWFFAATGYLASQGDGVMTYRYKNFNYDGSGSLTAVVKAVLLCPMKLMYECTKEPDRLTYIAQTLLPLLGLPLLTRKYPRYILLIPYILVNLMPNWRYQYDIFFQYNFGSSALLLYLCAVNIADIRWKLPRLTAAIAAVAISLCFFGDLVFPRMYNTFVAYRNNHASYSALAQALEQIPDDASVTAHTFYTVPLSHRDEIYDINYCTREQLLRSDFIVIKKTYKNEIKKLGFESFDELNSYFLECGYDHYLTEGNLIVYKKSS